MSRIGDILSKKDLYGHLVSLREAAIYDIFAQTCLHEFIKQWQRGEADPTILETELPEGILNLEQFMKRISVYGDRAAVETKRNANRSTTRNVFKEGFRITQAFYERNNIKERMTNETWYQFARILTNSLSHDFKLNFNSYDMKTLPVSYGNFSINASDDGNTLSMPISVLLSLYDEILNFVENELS